MSSNIVIKSRAIPASSRSKNYRNGTVVHTGVAVVAHLPPALVLLIQD